MPLPGYTATKRLRWVLDTEGHATQLGATETLLAHCAAGTAPDETLDPTTLNDEDRSLITRVVCGPDRLDHIKALVAAGLDPNQADGMNLTPLHLAAWEGLDDRVAYLLTLGPDLTHKNGFGGDALGTVIHGSENCPSAATRDHIACARQLLEAGAELDQRNIDGAGRGRHGSVSGGLARAERLILGPVCFAQRLPAIPSIDQGGRSDGITEIHHRARHSRSRHI